MPYYLFSAVQDSVEISSMFGPCPSRAVMLPSSDMVLVRGLLVTIYSLVGLPGFSVPF